MGPENKMSFPTLVIQISVHFGEAAKALNVAGCAHVHPHVSLKCPTPTHTHVKVVFNGLL